MTEQLYQITVRGKPFCEPVGVMQKNAIARALEGVSMVEIKPVEPKKPQLFGIDGGKK